LTKARTTRPNCVLLDADIIIVAHELGIWRWLVHSYRILVPSVVLRTEALFFRTKTGAKANIDLQALVLEGDIEELEATLEELALVSGHFDDAFLDTIHAGETEAIALVLCGRVRDGKVCSGDAHAIQALAMIGCGDCCVSLETLIGKKKTARPLDRHFTESALRSNLTQGSFNRISHTGLSAGS